jgi:hypothetical protein
LRTVAISLFPFACCRHIPDLDRTAAVIPSLPVWRAEARKQRDQARDHYTASMEQRIDVEKIYRQARRGLPATMDGTQPLPVPEACPVTLAELLSEPGE